MARAGPAGTDGPAGPSAGLSDVEGWYVAYRDQLIRTARLMTDSPQIAEEVVQEVFATVVRKGIRPDNPAAYLRTMVLNAGRSHLRRRRLERRLPEPEAPPVENPEVLETWSALARLPYPLRAVVVLRYYLDLPEAEIAEALGCRVGTVKSRLHRALAALRQQLEREGAA